MTIDASFREAKRRRAFRDAAVEWGVRSVFLVCGADSSVVRERLETRTGDASDADWAVHQAAARRWETGGFEDPRWQRVVPTGDGRGEAVAAARAHLRAVGLAES